MVLATLDAPGAALTYSPDGRLLAARLRSQDFISYRLAVIDLMTGEMFDLDVPPLLLSTPLVWSREGSILFAAQIPDSENFDYENPPWGFYMGSAGQIMQIAPQREAVPVRIGIVPAQDGCGGGSDLPADREHWREMDNLGGSFLTLAETPDGILHVLSCTGTTPVLLNTTTGENTLFSFQSLRVSRVRLSPDETQFAAAASASEEYFPRQLLIHNLDSSETRLTQVQGVLEQLIWSRNGESILYSTSESQGSFMDTMPSTGYDAVFAALGYMPEFLYSLPAERLVRLYRYTPADDTHTLLYEAEAHVIVRIYEAGDELIISQIPSAQAWLRAIFDGQVTPAETAFIPEVLRLPVSDGEAVRIGAHRMFTPHLP